MDNSLGPIAVAKIPRSHTAFLALIRFIVTCLTGNKYVLNPDPSVQDITADADAFEQTLTNAQGKSPGSLTDRRAKRVKLARTVKHIVDCVQGHADAQANPADAATVILSTGLAVKKTGKRTKPPLAATHGEVSGMVVLVALAVALSATYFWEYSLDQATWTSVPPTMKVTAVVSGLTPGKLYYFRLRTLTRKGESNYSDAVSIMVH